MQNYFENLEESATSIHAAMQAKGFWPQTLPLSVALAIGELYEGLEASRSIKGYTDYERFNSNIAAATALVKGSSNTVTVDGMLVRTDHFCTSFKEFIKDCVADELADFVIRCLDLSKGHRFNFAKLQANYEQLIERWSNNISWFTTEELAAQILHITGNMLLTDTDIGDSKSLCLSEALARVYLYCQANNINLNWHIHYKLLYNATRPVKHGKAF